MAWMAGQWYLPRLFVYHAMTPVGSDTSEQFKLMERKLLKIIMNPAMLLSFIFGGLLWLTPGVVDMSMGWFHGKLTLVTLMAATHGFMARCCRQFAVDQNQKSTQFYRVLNEVPTVLVIGIIVLAVVKPF
jgi:putative membrane protein